MAEQERMARVPALLQGLSECIDALRQLLALIVQSLVFVVGNIALL
jgi:hypothetical protein